MKNLVKLTLLPLLFAAPAHSDGYEPGSYKDAAPVARHQNYSASIPKPDLKRYVTIEEQRYLKRIHARAMRRMQEDRVSRRRYVEPVASRRYYREEEIRGSSCKGVIQVEGRIRGTKGRALNSAWNAWETSARARHGFAYGDRENARSISKPTCPTAGTNLVGKTVYICTVAARPCRED